MHLNGINKYNANMHDKNEKICNNNMQKIQNHSE